MTWPTSASTCPSAAPSTGAGKLIMPYVGIGVVIALAVLVVIFLMLRYTKFGRALYAVGGSEQSAAMMA